MNRREQRLVDWAIRDHNKIYDDARTLWNQTGDAAKVGRLLSERGWQTQQIIGYLTDQLGLSLECGREIANVLGNENTTRVREQN